MAWSQKPEERGALPVGRVTAIERRREPPNLRYLYKSPSQEIGEGLLGVAIIPIALNRSPVIFAAHALGADLVDEKRPDEGGNVYRHVVRLIDTDEKVLKDEFWTL